MAFRADDGETACGFHLCRQFNIRTAARHIGGDGHGAEAVGALSGERHDVCLLLVQLGVEHLVGNLAQVEHTAQQFAHVHARRTHEHGAACLAHLLDFGDNGGIFFALRLVDAVVHVVAQHGAVGGDFHNIEFVDVPKFAGFRDGRTRHAREFVVHAEVVLQRNGGEGLRGGFHLDVFLSLHGLMQSVAPAAAFHDAACLLVHNLHLPVHHDIFLVDAEHGVGFEQLQDSMHALALHGVVGEEFVFLGQAFLVGNRAVALEHGEFGGDVGQHEELVVFHLVGQPFVALVGEVYGVQFLVYHEIERLYRFGHAAVVVLHVYFLRLEHAGLDAGLGEELDERVVLGQCLVGAEELQEALFLTVLVAGVDELLGFGEILRGELALHLHEAFHEGLVLLEELVVALGHGTGDDERRARIVDQHGVHLVDDGVVVLALHEVGGLHRHVVAQVVEAELVVRAEGDVGLIGAAACFGVRLVLVDAVHRQAVEHIERPHPFAVALGEVVVHRHHVHAVAREGVEEHGEGGHERLSFARCHFGDFALMQHHAAEELHVVVHHVPFRVVAAGNPMVLVDSLVALDAHKVLRGGEFAVEVGGGHGDFLVLREAACRFLHDGEGIRQCGVEGFLVTLEHFLFEFVYLVEDDFAVFDRRVLNLGVEGGNLFLDVVGRGLNGLLQFLGFAAQAVVGEFFDAFGGFFHFVHPRLYEFHVARGLVAEDSAEKFIYIHNV